MNAPAAGMSELLDVASLVDVVPGGTVSRTVLKAEGVRLVLFAFDQGEELTEHTAAVPVMLAPLDGRLEVGVEGRAVVIGSGDLLHLGTRVPHTVRALEPSRLLLTMLDPRLTAGRASSPSGSPG